ncbi:hypothetical protein H5410_014593 [Solanum commersonii]|uniref:Uncharacterized protein n=1 Tax=Solanum commersonii TaxID=4109 RepID=A0A9J5ZRC7_SOLCO|nr:hypothetical protein H5410_014593 [Solanum commersonii]
MLRDMREIFVHEIKIQELGKYKYTKVPPKSCYMGVIFKSKLYKVPRKSTSSSTSYIQFSRIAQVQVYNGTSMHNIKQNFRLNWVRLDLGDMAANFIDYMFQKIFRANYSSINGIKVVKDREILHITRHKHISSAANKKNVRGQTQASYQNEELNYCS